MKIDKFTRITCTSCEKDILISEVNCSCKATNPFYHEYTKLYKIYLYYLIIGWLSGLIFIATCLLTNNALFISLPLIVVIFASVVHWRKNRQLCKKIKETSSTYNLHQFCQLGIISGIFLIVFGFATACFGVFELHYGVMISYVGFGLIVIGMLLKSFKY